MVKKISNRKGPVDGEGTGKQLHTKRLRLKKLHHGMSEDRSALNGVTPESLPPASSSNAARQARSRLNITFPVNWQDLHMRKKSGSDETDNDGT